MPIPTTTSSITFFSPTVLPYWHAVIAVCSQITFFTLYYAYYKNIPIADETNSSLLFALEDNVVRNVQLLCSVIALPMVFDLVVDVCGHVGFLTFAAEDRVHQMTMFMPTVEYAKEWAIRLLYIIALSIPASLVYTSPNDIHKGELYLMVIMMRLSTLMCMVMFVVSNTFDCTLRDYICSLGVSFFCCVGFLGQFTCYFTNEGGSGVQGWFYVATALVILCPLIFLARTLYHGYVLAKKAYHGGGGWRLLSSQELCFLTYTPVFIIGIFILFIVTCRHNLVLYSLTSADIIAHDVCMVIYALIATSLPVRIARLERRKAQSMIVNAKKNVSHALNAPLRILLSELDLMLGDDSAMTTMNRDGVIRLARIALAADAAIGSLRRVADVTRFDRGDRGGDSNSGSNEQLFSQEAISNNNSDTGSNRPLLVSTNKQLSEVARMRRYNVRFDEESIVQQGQSSHSRREADQEENREGGGGYALDRVSSSSFRSSRSSRTRSFRSTKLSSISDGTMEQTFNENHRFENHHQSLSLLQTNTFHSVNFGQLQLVRALQNEIRVDLGLGLDCQDAQGHGLDDHDSQGPGLGPFSVEKQTQQGRQGLGLGLGLGLGEMLRGELIDELNDSRSSGSTGWAGGHFYPPEHKEPPQDQGQGQDQDQDQGQEQGQDQGHGHQEGTAYSNGADLGRVDHRHPTPPHPDGDHGLLLIAVSNVVGEPHFERPRQLSPLPPPPQGPQLSPLTLPQHDGTSPSDPLHHPLGGVSPSNISLTIATGDGDRDGDRDRDIIALRGDDDEKSKLPINNNTTTISTTTTTEGKTTTADVSNGGNKMSVMNVSSALSIAEVAIRKSEMLQLQGNVTVAVLEVQSALSRLQDMGVANTNTSASDGACANATTTAGAIASASGFRVDKTWSHSCALCHRRLGVLYKVMGRYDDAETSIRLYIAHLENIKGHAARDDNADIHAKQPPPQQQHQPQERGRGRDDWMHDVDLDLEQHLAVAYTLLSTIIGMSSDGRSVEARQNDVKAGMLMDTYRASPRNSQKESVDA